MSFQPFVAFVGKENCDLQRTILLMNLPQNVPYGGMWYSASPLISQNMPLFLNVSWTMSRCEQRERRF